MFLRLHSKCLNHYIPFICSHLSFCELQSRGQEEPFGPDHVLLPGELLLQPGELLAGEARAHPFRLPTFSFERVQPCVHFGQ